jgi:hypothetical protein
LGSFWSAQKPKRRLRVMRQRKLEFRGFPATPKITHSFQLKKSTALWLAMMRYLIVSWLLFGTAFFFTREDSSGTPPVGQEPTMFFVFAYIIFVVIFVIQIPFSQ